MHTPGHTFLIAVFLFVFCGSLSAGPLATITVEAGDHARTDTPVSVPLAAVLDSPLFLHEVRGSSRVPVPAQLEQGTVPRLHWILAGTLPAGKTRTYELVTGQAPNARLVRANKGAKNLEIAVGDTVITMDLANRSHVRRTVIKRTVGRERDLVEVSTAAGALRCTGRHRFFVEDKGWTAAVDLQTDDLLVSATQEAIRIEQVRTRTLAEPVEVFNLSIEGHPYYFVGEGAILVHNDKP